MFRLSKQIEYSLMALSDLNESGGAMSVSEIAQKRAVSKNTLSKVMRFLQLGGVIKSRQGVAGGYEVSSKLNELSLYDLLVMFGEVKKLGCSDEESLCEISHACNIQTPIKGMGIRI